MNVHFIAIGGSAMHNMAIALKRKGLNVTGSDDEINEPSRTRLEKEGLLPATMGWDDARITTALDAIILGMHAREDNPELIKARALGLKIYSYPEYIYEQTKNKTRVVIGGSHGKTTITSMILHVLKYYKREFDFMVGAQLEGFDTMVGLTTTADVAIIEGDEYLASPIDRRPKFHLYQPNIALISGIAWDHINVFPTFEIYLEQFEKFIDLIEPNGCLIYCDQDEHLRKLASKKREKITQTAYGIPENITVNGITSLLDNGKKIELKIFGDHNLMNLNGARLVCEQIGISKDQFYAAIKTFTGAAKRLELVTSTNDFSFYKDFAHSPSKLKATLNAVKTQFPNRTLVACMELHTFSSLDEKFLMEYAGCMDGADVGIVYFNPHTIAHKKLKPITIEQVHAAFANKKLLVMTESKQVLDYIKAQEWKLKNLLMMSSGNFDGVDFSKLGAKIAK